MIIYSLPIYLVPMYRERWERTVILQYQYHCPFSSFPVHRNQNIDSASYLEIKNKLTDTFNIETDLVILNDATPLLKYEVYKNNILIFTCDKTLESNYKVKVLFEYNDVKKYLDLSYDRTIDRLKKEVQWNG